MGDHGREAGRRESRSFTDADQMGGADIFVPKLGCSAGDAIVVVAMPGDLGETGHGVQLNVDGKPNYYVAALYSSFMYSFIAYVTVMITVCITNY